LVTQFGQIVLFLLVGTLIAFFALALSFVLRSVGRDSKKTIPYECGLEPIGTPFVSMDVRFYIFALLFVIFDIEALYILPWAVAFKGLGMVALIEMMVFMLILFVGLIYAWRKGGLQWK